MCRARGLLTIVPTAENTLTVLLPQGHLASPACSSVPLGSRAVLENPAACEINVKHKSWKAALGMQGLRAQPLGFS